MILAVDYFGLDLTANWWPQLVCDGRGHHRAGKLCYIFAAKYDGVVVAAACVGNLNKIA